MRIKNLAIEDFRRFRRFRMTNLGRVNLIVGTNNCGKTTVLEAINVLMNQGNLETIWNMHNRRAEIAWLIRDEPQGAYSRQYEVRRLFRGHEIAVGSSFRLSADTESGSTTMISRIDEYRIESPHSEQLANGNPDENISPFSLSLSWSNGEHQDFRIPVGQRGTVTADAFNLAQRGFVPNGLPIRFVTVSSLVAEVVSKLFDDIVLTPEEDMVTAALRLIDPTVERIASAGLEKTPSAMRYSPRGGIFVRLQDVKDRVPIGSLGDGIWRLLGLALFVAQCSDGILLVDDIDTGLHHTVMGDMWKFIYSAAKHRNVQVFATTHSRDCYETLATVCRDSISDNNDVTIQRIEIDRDKAVAYTEQEIVAAAKHDFEVR
jgi:energy-coupling factor transporter ATP-binding protein EcfA2